MTFTATVRSNAIQLPAGVHLPDGTEVIVESVVEAPAAEAVAPPTLYDALEDFVGVIEGPPDFATEHDHYAHGAPKGTDRL